MAPYITPWSVRASAGISSSAARLTMAGMRLAPSSSEYSVWLWRWTKVLGACCIVWLWVWRTPARVYPVPIARTTAHNARHEDMGRPFRHPRDSLGRDRRHERRWGHTGGPGRNLLFRPAPVRARDGDTYAGGTR